MKVIPMYPKETQDLLEEIVSELSDYHEIIFKKWKDVEGMDCLLIKSYGSDIYLFGSEIERLKSYLNDNF